MLENASRGGFTTVSATITIVNDDILFADLLVPEFALAQHLVPVDPVDFPAWTELDFDAAGWDSGENILAIHGLNYRITSSDMLILPQLEVGNVTGYELWIESFANVRGEALSFGFDSEGDGLINAFEYLLGRDPTVSDGSLPFALRYEEPAGLFAEVELPETLPEDVMFEIQGSSDLSTGSWEILGTVSSPEGWISPFDRSTQLPDGVETTSIGPAAEPVVWRLLPERIG